MSNSSNAPASGWSEKEYRAWEKLRRRGLFLQILIGSILRFGVPIFLANYAIRRWDGHMVMDGPWWAWTVSVLSVFCIATGLAEWFWNEKQFRMVSALKQKVLKDAEERTRDAQP